GRFLFGRRCVCLCSGPDLHRLPSRCIGQSGKCGDWKGPLVCPACAISDRHIRGLNDLPCATQFCSILAAGGVARSTVNSPLPVLRPSRVRSGGGMSFPLSKNVPASDSSNSIRKPSAVTVISI